MSCKMTPLQNAMSLCIAVFHKYSDKEGDSKTLTKGELKDLITNEMGDWLGNASDKCELDKIFKTLDENGDDKIDFKEYITMVTCITVLCNLSSCKK